MQIKCLLISQLLMYYFHKTSDNNTLAPNPSHFTKMVHQRLCRFQGNIKSKRIQVTRERSKQCLKLFFPLSTKWFVNGRGEQRNYEQERQVK